MRKYLVFILILVSIEARPHQQEVYRIHRLSEPPLLDGKLLEKEWMGCDPLPLTMHVPKFKGDPTEDSEIFLAYDNQYLYLGGRMYYEDITDLQATSKKRDALDASNEYFGFVIDSYNDNENGMAFFTTPTGLRFDATVFNDAQGDFPINLSWNTFWDVEVSQDEYGWYAELRVPFTSLRFQDNDGKVIMGITIWRYMPSKNEVIAFPAVPNDLGDWSLWKPSRMQKVELTGVYSKTPVYIAPYVLGGIQNEFQLDQNETAYEKIDDFKLEAGLDLKYSLSSNFTMDLTVNPDFAQVEADDQQVNLTRFSLFFPEKRLFFQERSSIFEFNLGGPNRLFYSRNIGIYEEIPVRIFGGARIVGRTGPWDLGFLNMQTGSIDSIPSTNYSILRVRRQAINKYSYLGGMITNKIGTDGNFNTGIGLDGIIRLFKDDYVQINIAQTYENGVSPSPFSPDNSKMRINFEKRKIKGFGYDAGFSRVGKQYNPEMGFELRENYYRFGDQIWWGWIPGEKSKILNHKASFIGDVWINNTSQKIESAAYGLGWNFISKESSFGNFQVSRQIENLTDTFEISDDVFVPPGDYNFLNFNSIYATSNTKLFFVSFNLNTGTFYDGYQFVGGISPSWKVSSSFELSGDYFFNRVDFKDREQLFIAHLARLRTTLMFNTKISASLFLQHNSADNISIGNFRFRYNPREGNDLYIVYNHSLNSHRDREDPLLPVTDNSTFLIKYTHTFVLGK